MKYLTLFLMLCGLCGFCCGDIIMDVTGEKIIWPDGEIETGDGRFIFGDMTFFSSGGDTTLAFLDRLLFTSGGVNNIDDITGTNTGGFSIGGTSGITILSSGNPLRLFANDDIIINPQGFTTQIVGDLHVSGDITENNLIGGSSIKLLGSSANEFLAVAQYIDVVQQAGANKFELRLSGSFTGGSDTDYELEIDGTVPPTFKWKKDTGAGFGSYTTEVAIPVGFQELDEAIQIAFLNSGTDAFVLGDKWTFTAVNSPTTIFNVDTQTPLVTADALSVTNALTVADLVVTNSTDFNGVPLTDTGDVLPSANTKELGSVDVEWGGLWIDGLIGIPAVDHTLGINVGSSFDFLQGGADVVLNFDGSGANTGTVTYKSATDIFEIDTDLQIDGGLTVDGTTLVVDPVNDRVGIGTATPDRNLEVFGAGSVTIEVESSSGIAQFIANAAANNDSRIVLQEAGVNKWFIGNDADSSDTFIILNSSSVPVFVIQTAGDIGIGEIVPETLLEMTSTAPYLTLHNSTEENGDGGRESRIIFKGEQLGTTETTLARIEVSHDGAADDEKGKFVISVNDGDDGDTPTDRFKIDAAGVTHVGDGTNESQFEADGTLEFNGDATVWDDLRVPLTSIRITGPGGSTPPDEVMYKGSVVLAFGGAGTDDEKAFFSAQIPHSYLEGSDIVPHVHWTPEDNTAGNVRWVLTYSWANFGATYPGESTDTIVVACDETTDKHQVDDFTTIDGTGKTTSSMLLCSIQREDSDGTDTYDNKDAFLTEIDFHFEKDTVGTRDVVAK